MTITREEFNQFARDLHDKIDGNKDQSNRDFLEIKETMVEINTTIKLRPTPVQPCCYFNEHLKDHKEKKRSWTQPIIVGIVAVFFIFIQEPIKHVFKALFEGPK